MGTHYQSEIDGFEKQLQERVEKLLLAIHGHDAYSEDEDDHISKYSRLINPSEIRIAVDDFQTILKEIKRVLK